jgi:membrane protein
MALREIGSTLRKTYEDIMRNHTMALAAGLAYYFVLSLFPALILAASIVSFLPVPNLFDRILVAMQSVVPADSMGLVRAVLKDVITPNKGSFLTIGILGTLWSASSGFASLIEALNVAYDVPETRPFWKTRLLAVGLMVVIGGLMVLGALSMFLGPQFGAWLASKLHLSWVFATVWPYLRWVISVAFTVLAVETLFFWAPNVKQRFWATLPGAALGVGFWIASSYALGLYFQQFAHFNKTYGTLGAAVALMVWLYWSWFFILAGAEINSELLKAQEHGKLRLKQPPPKAITARPAWEEAPENEAA